MLNPSAGQFAALLPEGTLLKGRYRVHHYLSSGGFGNTYYAQDENLSNKVVAIKEFFIKGMTHREDDQRTVTVSNEVNKEQFESLRQKFYKEAQRMANLGDCDHVCSVTDFFEENDTSYYVMQYIDGVSLGERVKASGPIRESEVRKILDQMLDALQDIHQKNIFHFDIKPANIMLGRKGKAILIDFGASKIIQDDTEASRSVSTLCYTPRYAPGEQIAQAYDTFGPWTDLYALGATMYYISTAQLPPNVSDIADEGDAAFKFPDTLTNEMREMILWLMNPKRKLRPSSAEEVRERKPGFFSAKAIAVLEAMEEGEEPEDVEEGYPNPEGNKDVVEVDIYTGDVVLNPENPAAEGEPTEVASTNNNSSDVTLMDGSQQPVQSQPVQAAFLANPEKPRKSNNTTYIIGLVTVVACLVVAGLVYLLRRDHFSSASPVEDSISTVTDSTSPDTATQSALPDSAPAATTPAPQTTTAASAATSGNRTITTPAAPANTPTRTQRQQDVSTPAPPAPTPVNPVRPDPQPAPHPSNPRTTGEESRFDQ